MLNNEIYKIQEITDFRDLIKNSANKYSENIAYKFKKNLGKENEIVVNKKYKDIKNEIEGLSTELLELGLENKKIAVISNNRYEWCVSYFAITTGNMVVVPLDKMLPDNEIENLIIRSGADSVIYENKYSEVFDKIKKEGKSNLKTYINMDLEKSSNEELAFHELANNGIKKIQDGNTRYKDIKINNEKMSILIFTSGTTANPKGVMLSQKNICSNIMAMAKMSKMYSDDILLSFLPLHHTFECTITFLYGFYSGVTVAFCDGLKYIAKNLKEYNISVFVAVPLVLETMYKKIDKEIEKQGKQKLVKSMTKISNSLLKLHIDIRSKLFKSILDKMGGKLRIIYYGAAPMNKEVIEGYKAFGIESVQGYGLTETSPLVSAETDKQKKPGTVGMAPYNIQIMIDEKGKDGIGEICVKGPNVMIGYYEDEKATSEAIKDGWFHTGDLGYFDEEGYLVITGRKKEVIVLKNGENIFPSEIENIVNKLAYVKESLLFPRTNAKNEIALGIKIVYDEDILKDVFGEREGKEYNDLIWNDIKEINKDLSQFKRIKELILTKDMLEKTTTQKIKRNKEIERILGNK